MCYLSLKNTCYCFPFFVVSLPDPAEGMLPLLKRLFGVKGLDCFLSCLAFRKIRFLQFAFQLISSVKDGFGTYCVLFNSFSRLRLFCTGSGPTVPIACELKYFTCLSSAGVTLY